MLAALAAALTVGPTAHAGLIGTGSASYCDPTSSQPFAPADTNSYTLLPGGSFESGTVPWALSGGAKIVPGNETQYLHSRQDSHSLTVLDGGTVQAGGTWTPSPRVELLVSNLTSLVGTEAVAFRFTAVGRGAAYQLDDVYLDPWKRF